MAKLKKLDELSKRAGIKSKPPVKKAAPPPLVEKVKPMKQEQKNDDTKSFNLLDPGSYW